MVLTRTLSAHKAREIRERIDRQLELWERCIHSGLVGDVLAEGRAREGHIARSNEEEEDRLARSFHITLISGKLQQAVYWAKDREKRGGSSPQKFLHEDRATGYGCPS